MPTLQCFILDLEKRLKPMEIITQIQNVLFCILRRKHFVWNVLGKAISPLYATIMSIK
jgi:hypothetical protein